MKYNLKWMAEGAYIMGLSTIGEMANHMTSHYDAYFLISDVTNYTGDYAEFCDAVASHDDSSIDLWLTAEDKKRLDDELDKVLSESPGPTPEEFAKDIEELTREN